MNTTDQIDHLMRHGVVSLTVAKSPKNTTYVKATQFITTGEEGNNMEAIHQVDDAPLPELLNQLLKQVEHINKIKSSNLVVIPKTQRHD